MLKKIISNPEDETEAALDYDNSTGYAETPVETSYATPQPMAPPQMNSKNILSSDVVINGSLEFAEELILDGSVEGQVNSSGGHLTVGENAKIKGEVKTKGVVVMGKIDGNITVTDRCELKASAQIVGDIKAGALSIEEGAAFMGQSSVGNVASSASSSSSKSSKS